MEGSVLLRLDWQGNVSHVLILDQPEAILTLAPVLQQLASRCGQPGAMHWLPYFLDRKVMGRRLPRLVLLLRPEDDGGRGLHAEDVEAAVLLFEYEVLGRRTGVYTTGDAVGFSSVIAPWGDRARTAALASRALMEAGATLLLTTYEGSGDPRAAGLLRGLRGAMMAQRHRKVSRMLPLRMTLEGTLAQMGKSTRANLRRYRRRAEAKLGCGFVADAAEMLREEDVLALNEGSLNPTASDEVLRRLRAASTLPGGFVSGLRAADGRWLALLGGWRQDGVTVLHWQINAAGFERLSLGTVARSYLLEQEIGRGTEQMMFYGGTPHPMRHAFTCEPVADLLVRRKGLRGAALEALSRLYHGPSRRLGKSNFLAETLRTKDFEWIATAAKEPRQRAPLLKPRQTQTMV